MKKIKLALLTVALVASPLTWAQDGKSAQVSKFLELQRPGVEALARALVEQSSAPIAQAGAGYLRTQVPEAKREAAGKAADAELRKYFDDAYPMVRDKAVQLAPTTIGPILENNFSEDELRQLNAWISSPLSKKYQELNPQMQQALTKAVVTDTRAAIEPKMQALDANVAKALGAPANPEGAAAPAAKAPAKKK